jgi:hypothetical protein
MPLAPESHNITTPEEIFVASTLLLQQSCSAAENESRSLSEMPRVGRATTMLRMGGK